MPIVATTRGDGHRLRSSGGSLSVDTRPPRPRAVEGIRIPLGKSEMTRRRELNHQVHQHRDRGADREQAALGQPLPPCRADQQEGQHRDDQDRTDLPDVNGHAQGQASQTHLPGSRAAAPQQQRDPRHDERLEQHIRHDRLLGLKLIAIQQHRRGSKRGRPAPQATAEQDRIERQSHSQAQDVLGRRDRSQSTSVLQWPQQDQVTKRIQA